MGAELQVSGIVQGVGFRPFICRLAADYGYTGFVVNTDSGVKIHIEQPDDRFQKFLNDVRRKSPPLARIGAIERNEVAPENRRDFSILASSSPGRSSVAIPPDTSLCAHCLRELFDPADRRYLYPFINCTDCGPRFSIVENLPYDRPYTSMRHFSMCSQCETEYKDPVSRRFHAQPNSCRRCGPVLSWYQPGHGLIECAAPLAEASRALADGRVVAIRGVGGFHLAADACSEEAVQKVRRSKARKAKPLAVMFADPEAVKGCCHVSTEEERLLTSFRKPIVLLRRRSSSGLAPGLAPGIDEIGVMLPYAPVHHLLFACPETPEALVMTSANPGGEPICADNREAMTRISGLADFFLLHNREIVHPLDDSVARIVSGRRRLVRRSRGYVPEPFSLNHDFPDVLACGGDLKNTFCFIKQNKAFLSQHIGSLENPGVFRHYQENIRSLAALFEVNPKAVACDLHPDYLSRRHARSCNLPLVEVQHHHGHAASVMAEHGLTEECLAVIMDGTGLGPDNTIWGGEILLADYSGYRRLACLQPLAMPGGDLAARELYRMGFAAWWASRDSGGPGRVPPSLQGLSEKNRDVLAQMIVKGVNTPETSSCGRLFDAVASLLGLRDEADYEGQSGMELETMAYRVLDRRDRIFLEPAGGDLLPVSHGSNGTPAIMASTPMIRELLRYLENGYGAGELALEFHGWLVSSISAVICRIVDSIGQRPVVLSGGCFQNTLLLRGLEKSLESRNLKVYSPEQLPANDGGLALGQAVIAGTLLRRHN